MNYILKEGVSLVGLKLVMRPVIQQAGRIWYTQGKRYLRITSTFEGSHSISSLHPYGLALDLELPPKPRAACADLRQILGCNYDVVLETDHVHVEYDP